MVILGLDPGSRRTGYGAIEVCGSRLRRVAGGVLRPPREAPLSARLLALHGGLKEVLQEVRPDTVAMEECFMGRHAQAALTLGHARGALMISVLAQGIPCFEYAPRLVKLAATGSGRASKEQVLAMIPRLLTHVPDGISFDEADALAVAICHAHRERVSWEVTV